MKLTKKEVIEMVFLLCFLLGLPEWVRKATGLTAATLGLLFVGPIQ